MNYLCFSNAKPCLVKGTWKRFHSQASPWISNFYGLSMFLRIIFHLIFKQIFTRKVKATENVIFKVKVNENFATLKRENLFQRKDLFFKKRKFSVQKINENSRTKASMSVKQIYYMLCLSKKGRNF